MSESTTGIYMSDEISDIVDMGQFYEDVEDDYLYVKVYSKDNEISGKVCYIKTFANSIMKIRFFSDVITSSTFIFSDVESIRLSTLDGSNINEFNNFSVSSKSFEINNNNRYECELIVQISNT
tara:strand:+ start:227 stop:595 length:369 start_codon:yes stop_codon:yes gene_type:complete